MDYIIKTQNLVKKFGDFTAVNGVNLQIKQGELFSLLGENGAGKTTTIKMLCFLLQKTCGTIEIDGKNTEEHAQEIKSIINLSPQETAVAPNLTVRENLLLMANLYGYKNQASVMAQNIITMLDLTSFADKKAKTLSGGMQRRCSIAMALITNPKILFLDEPTLGLDVRARRELWKVIQGLKGKVTILLTTHYMEEAEKLSDRVGIIKKGKLTAVGTVQEIKDLAKTTSFEDAFLTLTDGGEANE